MNTFFCCSFRWSKDTGGGGDWSETPAAEKDEELLLTIPQSGATTHKKKKLVKEFLDAFIFKNDLQKQYRVISFISGFLFQNPSLTVRGFYNLVCPYIVC